jgi:O-antigen/teichoic acid export membrane protein
MKPPILEYHNTDKDLYLRMNKRMYAIVFYLSLAASALICVIAPLFVELIYGSAYLPSVSPLRIVVWYVAFSYLGVARDAWIVCERKQKYLKYLYLGSAILNVALNYLLIPAWNVNGAALASLLTQMSTIFLFPLMFRDLRPNVKLIWDAILLRGVLPGKKNKNV